MKVKRLGHVYGKPGKVSVARGKVIETKPWEATEDEKNKRKCINHFQDELKPDDLDINDHMLLDYLDENHLPDTDEYEHWEFFRSDFLIKPGGE